MSYPQVSRSGETKIHARAIGLGSEDQVPHQEEQLFRQADLPSNPPLSVTVAMVLRPASSGHPRQGRTVWPRVPAEFEDRLHRREQYSRPPKLLLACGRRED
jgi:hypothetical protein